MPSQPEPLRAKPDHDSLAYLWRQRTLLTGPPHHPRSRHYYADCLLFGIEGNLTVHVRGQAQSVQSRIFLLRGDTPFYMEVEGQAIGVLYLDYLGLDFQQLKTQARQGLGRLFFDFDDALQDELLARIAQIHQHALPIQEVEKLLFDLLAFDRSLDRYNAVSFPAKSDARLAHIINLYLNGTLRLDAPLEAAAKAVNLSTSRVVQLFREQLGINFRTFRNRQRIHLFLLATAFGKSQLHAALEAGFVDQAHFCRRFKESAGVNASVYLSKMVKRLYFVETEMASRYHNDQPVYGALNRLTGKSLAEES